MGSCVDFPTGEHSHPTCIQADSPDSSVGTSDDGDMLHRLRLRVVQSLCPPSHMLLGLGLEDRTPWGQPLVRHVPRQGARAQLAEGTADPNMHPHTLLHVSPSPLQSTALSPLQCHLQKEGERSPAWGGGGGAWGWVSDLPSQSTSARGPASVRATGH